MNKFEKYMDDPDIIDEPMAMREVHAIRLMMQDETKDMTSEQLARYYSDSAEQAAAKHGFQLIRPAERERKVI